MPIDGGGRGMMLMGHTLKFQLTVDVLDFDNCQNNQTLSYPLQTELKFCK